MSLNYQAHPMSFVHPEAKIGNNVQIGPFCVIGPNAEIGDDCVFQSNIVVEATLKLAKEINFFNLVQLVLLHKITPTKVSQLKQSLGTTTLFVNLFPFTVEL